MEKDQAVKFIHELLRGMVARKASDLFITAGFPPAFKVDGKMTPVSNQSLTPQHTQELARSLMNDKQAQEFEGHLRRRHRLRQIHLTGGDDRLSQREQLWSHHHHRRPDRVRA
jgi:Tfp pilus assembly ATPase PilU